MTMLKSCEIDFNNPPAKAEEVISAGDVPLGTQEIFFVSLEEREQGKVIMLLL